MQVLPGIYLVNGFPYGRHQNGYLVRAAGAAFMVDSGDLGDDSFQAVQSACERWGLRLEEVSHLLVTHAHFDHASHAARLKRMGVKVVASQDTAEAMALGDERCIGYAVGRKFEPCEADVVARDGQELRIGGLSVRCIAAPGHARGLMIYELALGGERIWFCGDLVEVGPECKSLELGWAGGPDYDRQAYLATLRRLAGMECDSLLAGHGPPALGIGARLVGMAYARALAEWR